MTQLFGFSIEERKKKEKLYSPAPPNNDEGTSTVAAGAYFGQYVDLDGIPKNNNDFDLIRKYREIALHPECDNAIDDIINESISSDLDFAPVNIELSNLEVGDKIKKQIREEFKLIIKLLDFDKKCHNIFRRWYIDGRMHYHKMIDFENPKEGIKELRYIDALKIKKVREVVKKKSTLEEVERGPSGEKFDYGEVLEYYMYFPHGYKASQAKGLKIASDAICAVSSGLMDHNRNSVLSFLHKAIKSVNQLRMIEDSLVIYRMSRRSNEITRDELKFAKFVGRLRKKFSELFHDLLKTQLVLKGIMTLEDWEDLKENIQYDFIFDNHFTELKDNELLTERLNSVGLLEPYIGKYFSAEYVRKQVLHFTDEEIEEMDIQIEKEKSLGIIQDPMAMMGDESGGQLPPAEGGAENSGGGGDLDSSFAAAISSSDYNKGNI